jgi:truncated hemoglobin YjbI
MIIDNPVAKSLFEFVGGQAAVDRIVDGFYRRMDTLPAGLFAGTRPPAPAHAAPAVSDRCGGTRRLDAQ